MKGVPGLTSDEANSIVAQRGKKQFTSLADLLDVQLAPHGAPPAPAQQSPQTDQPGGQGGPGSGLSSDQGLGLSPGQPAAPSANQPAPAQGQGGPSAPLVFDRDRLMQISDYVGVTDDESLQGLVNVNTAPAQVLACLPGLTDATAAEIVVWRDRHKDGFRTVADVLDVQGMTTDGFKAVCPYISARSDAFSVRSFGVLQNREVYRCVEAVLDRSDSTVRIRQWRELD